MSGVKIRDELLNRETFQSLPEAPILAAPTGEAFTLTFDNQAAGIPHNVAVYTDSAATQLLGGATGPGDFITGPASVTYDFDPLDAGQFYFRCDIHPTMQGTFVVA